MRPADRLDAFDDRVVVEHDAAAAIDLEIDEAGRENVAGLDDCRAGRNFAARNDCLDHTAANDERGILMPGFAVEDALARQGRRRRS